MEISTLLLCHLRVILMHVTCSSRMESDQLPQEAGMELEEALFFAQSRAREAEDVRGETVERGR